MSSQSKRRAESEEVSHKKKPRKGGGEEEEFKQGEDEGLDAEDGQDYVSALDNDNTIPVDIRTRGERVDYTKVGLDDDNGFEARKEVSEEKKGVPPGARSPQRVLAEGVEVYEEDGDDEEEGEYGEYEDDDGTGDYEEDEEE